MNTSVRPTIPENVFSVEPANNQKMFVTWMLGNFCPYKCSYCNSDYNGGNLPYPELSLIEKTFASLPSCNIMFKGGEPTYHPEFEQILDLQSDRIKIQVISNGARTLHFWERIQPKIDRVILTYHVEYANFDRFVRVAFTLGKKTIAS